MRLISFQHSGRRAVGVMTSDTAFIDLSKAAPNLPTNMRSLISLGDAWQQRVEQAIKGKAADFSIDDIIFDPVVVEPHATWAVALNYKAHQEETGLKRSEYPEMFLRVPTSIVGHKQDLMPPKPAYMNAFDFEGELAVIIGKPGRYIEEKDALAHIAGYASYNEGTVRAYQRHNRQFGLGKNFEKSGAFGPWLMTPDEFGDYKKQSVITRSNGVEKQRCGLVEMLNSVENQIAYISEGIRLQPGDVIATGTPGSLPGTDKHMQYGDVVEVEITGLGVLKNTVGQQA